MSSSSRFPTTPGRGNVWCEVVSNSAGFQDLTGRQAVRPVTMRRRRLARWCGVGCRHAVVSSIHARYGGACSNRYGDNRRDGIRMEVSHPTCQRREARSARLDQEEDLPIPTHLALPPIDRGDSRDNVGAGGQMFFDEDPADGFTGLAIRTGHQDDDELGGFWRIRHRGRPPRDCRVTRPASRRPAP